MKILLNHMQGINETFWSILFSPLTPMPFLRYFWPMKKAVAKAEANMAALREFYREICYNKSWH